MNQLGGPRRGLLGKLSNRSDIYALAFSWVLVVMLSTCLLLRGGGSSSVGLPDLRGPAFDLRPVGSQGSSCVCGKDGYCLCTPNVAIDCIVEVESDDGQEESIILVRRKDSGKYATIGGFVEVGESVEDTVVREVEEETGLTLQPGSFRLLSLFSDPKRDHRRHTVSVVFTARVSSLVGLRAGDDAKGVEVIPPSKLRSLVADEAFDFDHAVLVADYLELKHKRPFPEDRIPSPYKRSSCPTMG